MARVESLIKLNGKIGDLSFYKTKNAGYQARMKGGISAERIAKDPAFARTRENGSEFGRAQQLGKKLRDLLRDGLFLYADSLYSSRLANRILKVIQSDVINNRGDRQLLAENMLLLQGLESNVRSSLNSITLKPLTIEYDRSTGIGVLSCSQLVPQVAIAKLAGATHVQYGMVLQEFTGDDADLRPTIVRSDFVDLSDNNPMDLTLSGNLLVDPNHVVLQFVCTGYFQMVNGGYYPLANGLYNAMTISKVILP